jgi:alpha-tubulin suppressor-like RCC1 family protein
MAGAGMRCQSAILSVVTGPLLAMLLAVTAVAALAGGPASAGTTGPGRPAMVAVTAGRAHTCALPQWGDVTCWGDNSAGQLGDGGACGTACATPVAVGLPSDAVAVSAGGDHTCALTMQAAVLCWGEAGMTGCDPSCSTPVAVPGLEGGSIAVSAGGGHTCVVTSAGGLKCWGDNDWGQLGDGQACGERCATTVDVAGFTSGAVAVAAGARHTCALTNTGGVRCWGHNDAGQLGDGRAPREACECQLTPVQVFGLASGVTAIVSGELHVCARTVAGGLRCWGDNTYGAIGDGRICGVVCRFPAEPLQLPSGVTSVAGGGAHTCAVVLPGTVRCWGAGESGQLGLAPDRTCAERPCSVWPVSVSGVVQRAAAVAAGGGHSCALLATGGVKCWGDNSSGQLGDGGACGTRCASPVRVSGLGPAAPGDVSCDGRTNSVDAALALQRVAGLLARLPCAAAADVDADGAVDAIDAALILQAEAGLIGGL